jgi:lipoprotein-anchoring transpeptidase ErfK/SrfK
MKRNSNKNERNQVSASIWIKTMKTSRSLTLLATLCFAATLSTSVQADGYFFNGSSKHGTTTETRYVSNIIPDLGKFTWIDENSTVNHIVVSLDDQSLRAYNGTELVAYSNISSGKPGHETPTGTFTVSQKDMDHHSNLYENAPMPFYMRLTDGGVGLHAGFIPGYPASHGCVRLPIGMARELFQHVEEGTPVEIVGAPTTTAQNALTTSVPLAQN